MIRPRQLQRFTKWAIALAAAYTGVQFGCAAPESSEKITVADAYSSFTNQVIDKLRRVDSIEPGEIDRAETRSELDAVFRDFPPTTEWALLGDDWLLNSHGTFSSVLSIPADREFYILTSGGYLGNTVIYGPMTLDDNGEIMAVEER